MSPYSGARYIAILLCLLGLMSHSPTLAVSPCGEVATFVDHLAPDREIHVALDGSDTTGNGSAEQPYRTINHAVDQAAPGSAVVIHAGTYEEEVYVSYLRGTPEAPIWIGGAPGETRPVISGGSEGFHLSSAQYVVLHDLEISNAQYNGINCDDSGDYGDPSASHHLLFKNLFIHDIGGTGNQDGLKLSGIRDFIVVNSQFSRSGGNSSGSGIDMVGCHRGLIALSEFEDMSGNAIQIKGGSSDIEIRWCRIRNGGARAINIGGSTGFSYFRPPLSTTTPNFEASNVRVLANIIESTTCAFAFVGSVNCRAANNTIINPSRWLFRILQETVTSPPYTFLPSGNNSLENNLFYFDRSALSTYVNIGPNTDSSSFTFLNNLWFAHDNPPQSTPTLPAEETGGIHGQNPGLEAPGTGDYHIGQNSAAAQLGIVQAALPGDIDGRCYLNPPSIGAYEILVKGDLNGNGDVELNDALLGLLVNAGEQPTGIRPDYEASAADVDDDLAVGTAEVIYILQTISTTP